MLPLPEGMDARTLGSTPSMPDPCAIELSRLPASRHRRILRIALRIHRRAPPPAMPANAGLSDELEWEREAVHAYW